MAIKISLFGEGPKDYGTIQGDDKPDPATGKHKGDIQLFLERILEQLQHGKKVYFQPFPVDPKSLKFHMHRDKDRQIPSLAGRVKRAIQVESGKGRQGLVVLIDDRREDARNRIEELKKGRSEAYEEGVRLPTAIGTAIKEIEAWILADENAQGYGFGEKIGRIPLPVAPEEISDPKSVYSQRYGDYQSAHKEGQEQAPDERTCRECIINQIAITRLAERCPQGFKPFLEEVKGHILPLFAKKP